MSAQPSSTRAAKCYNSQAGHRAKVELRQRVLELVRPARVFDAFCGPDGEMYRDVWCNAQDYVGCDLEFKWGDARKRFVADNRRVMRCVDLSRFNVFDIDAFGDPWEQMTILAHRRRWLAGERGAVLITDGSDMKTRYGSAANALAHMAGVDGHRFAACKASGRGLRELALKRWVATCRVKLVGRWQAQSNGSGKGAQLMVYSALVFTGHGAPSCDEQ